MNFTITIDEGVAMPGEDREDPRLAQLRQMKIGDSFFVAGAERGDFRSLLYLGRQHGIFLKTAYEREDPIYMKAGVRIWRVEEPEPQKRRSKKPQPAVKPDDDDL